MADIRDPYHCLMFSLPSTALERIAHEAGAPRIGDLRHRPGVSIDDPVVRHLLSALLLAMRKPQEAHPLFLDYIALTLITHTACVYGGMNPIRGMPRGGLAPWQERRTKEMMTANVNEELPLSRLANECGLSMRHFARAFPVSTGVAPHRWLLMRRADRATELLRSRALSLADVAVFCGCADQSHFTRVFTVMIGVSPGVWRRMNNVQL